MTPPLVAIENRICVLQHEQRALLQMGLADEADMMESILVSLELLRADHFAVNGPIVVSQHRPGTMGGPK